jgi:hypothetical protein
MTSESLRPPARERPRVRPGLLGSALALSGAVLLLVSFTAVTWLSDLGPARFADIRELLDSNGDHVAALSKAYFGWLGWALLIAAVVTALVANLSRATGNGVRALSAVIGVLGMALTFLAIKFTAEGAYGEYLKHAAVGFYLAIGGFLLAAAGALAGLRRR